MNNSIIQLDSVDVFLNGKKVLSDISWRLQPGEHWAFIGANGAGKSTLMKLVRGDIWPAPGTKGKRTYRFGNEEQSDPIGVKEKIAIISAESHDAYKKYNCFLSGEEVIHTGFFDSIWLQEKPDEIQLKESECVISQLNLDDLRKKDFRAMSQGEARKILIARALVSNPRILVLDEFCNGLDSQSRKDLLELVEKIAEQGVQFIIATHRLNEIVDSISHALLLKDGRIIDQGTKVSVLTEKKLATIFNHKLIKGRKDDTKKYNSTQSGSYSESANQYLIRISNADVYLDSKKILSQINWQVNPGENWAVLGNNGAGKSTLLKLIHGDVVIAFGGEISRFGVSERANVWDIKKMIGYVSADFQANYSHNLTGLEVVQSGFYSSIGLWDNVTDEQKCIAEYWIEYFGLENLAVRAIRHLSYGQFRKILIARAMVKDPFILVLDEPCDGLDIISKDSFLHTVEKLSLTKTSIIYATHFADELIPQINNVVVLENGRIISQGKREKVSFFFLR